VRGVDGLLKIGISLKSEVGVECLLDTSMIIKASTVLRNNYGLISDLAHAEEEPIYITKNGEGDLVVMSIEAFERREETLKLRARMEAAEKSRLAGEATYTLEDSRKRLEAIYNREDV